MIYNHLSVRNCLDDVDRSYRFSSSPLMDPFNDPAVWDIDNTPDSANIVDHDLFQLLQKQYLPLPPNPPIPTYPSFMDSVNPQNLSMFSLPNMTPSSTSEDSSPSPPITHQESPQDAFSDDPTLKRKASTDVLESEPNNKNQHISESFFNVSYTVVISSFKL